MMILTLMPLYNDDVPVLFPTSSEILADSLPLNTEWNTAGLCLQSPSPLIRQWSSQTYMVLSSDSCCCTFLHLRCSGEQSFSTQLCTQSSQQQPLHIFPYPRKKAGNHVSSLPQSLVRFAIPSFQVTKLMQSVKTTLPIILVVHFPCENRLDIGWSVPQ